MMANIWGMIKQTQVLDAAVCNLHGMQLADSGGHPPSG